MAFDAYVKFEGIEGESTDAGHENWIEILSYSHGMQQDATIASSGGMHTGGRVSHSDITLVKTLDGSTPNLQLACCQGKSIPTVEIEFCRAGGDTRPVPFLKISLTDAVLTSVSAQATGGSDFPTEEVTLTYKTVQWSYTKTDTKGNPTGDVVAGWDLIQNTKL